MGDVLITRDNLPNPTGVSGMPDPGVIEHDWGVVTAQGKRTAGTREGFEAEAHTDRLARGL